MLDLAPQLVRDSAIVDAFVIERQHLLVKRVAEHVKNTRVFNDAVLASVLTVQLREAKEVVVGDALIGRTSPLQGCPGMLVANKLSIHSWEMQVDEVVVRGREAAVILACASEGADLFIIVSPMAHVTDVTPHASKFRRTVGMAVWRAADAQHCLAWLSAPNGIVFVLRR